MAAPPVRAKLRGRTIRKLAVAISPATLTHSCDGREQMIREAAYLKAARRGFEPGHELEDWLAAEQELDLRIAGAEVKQGFYG
jgi:hypothetical protein